MPPFFCTDYPPGLHILLDFWGARHLSNLEQIENALRKAAQVAGATILEIRLHQFGDQGGITGVALLAESHISIHTWPETEYAALDVFMCGNCDARRSIAPLQEFFNPSRVKISQMSRGREDDVQSGS